MVVLEGVLVLMAAAKQAAADLIRTKPSPKENKQQDHQNPLLLLRSDVLGSYDQLGSTTFPVGFA